MIGERLKEERERLGLTQPAFAELAGAKKRTLIDWEKGVSSPTSVQLAALSTQRVDVLYILTGIKTPEHILDEAQRMFEFGAQASDGKPSEELSGVGIDALKNMGSQYQQRKPKYDQLIKLLERCPESAVDSVLEVAKHLKFGS